MVDNLLFYFSCLWIRSNSTRAAASNKPQTHRDIVHMMPFWILRQNLKGMGLLGEGGMCFARGRSVNCCGQRVDSGRLFAKMCTSVPESCLSAV